MDQEQVYDNEIFPLMKRVIEICHQHKIAMVADFQLKKDGDEEDIHCTTSLASHEFDPDERIKELARTAAPRKSSLTMINTFDGDGKMTRSEAILG